MKISRRILLALFLLFFIFSFIQVGYSQEKKEEKLPPEKSITDQHKISEEDLKNQKSIKVDKKQSTASEEAQHKYNFDVAEILRESQKNMERSINAISIVATLMGVLVGLLVLVLSIASATGFIQLKRDLALRKEIKNDSKYIRDLRVRAQRDLDALRKEIEKVQKPSLIEKPSIESKGFYDYFGSKLDNYESLGIPLSSFDYNTRGLDFLNKEQYSLALKEFEKALELKPDDAVTWYYKGHALYSLERYDEAVKAFNKAVDLDPNYPEAWHMKGCTFYELERYREALADFIKAIELDPKLSEPRVGKGLALFELKQYDEALEALDFAIGLYPENAEIRYDRASIHSIKMNREKALSDLTIAIKLDAEYKNKAKASDHFKHLWDDEDFKKITT